MNESMRGMVVETTENTVDADGKAMLTVKGRSFEKIFLDRIARGAMTNLTTEAKWVLTGTPGNIARKIVRDICITGTLDTDDIVPFLLEGSIFPEDTIPEPTDVVTIEVEPTTVYDALKNICDLYDLGFRIVRNYDTSQLYFDVYSGSNHTSSQTSLTPVIFSPELDNLQNTSELTTIATNKNVAYVFSPVGFEVVYPAGIDHDISGFDRQVLLVKADDITDTNPSVASALMIQKGKEELSKNRSMSAFDGEISQRGTYRYGIDYQLGDLIELRNSDGATNKMRVTEQIFVSDQEGDRSYPTLTISEFIAPGSWLAWDYNQQWFEVGATQYWNNV